MRSNSRAVYGPMDSAQCTMRDGVHSRCAWWDRGRCSAMVTVSMATRTQMRSYALTFIKDLDGRRCRTHFHQVVHQVVRHAVVVRIKSDVVIDVHSGAGPLAEIKRLGRKRI